MLDLKKLLTVMKEQDASDLYITEKSPPCYRVNGTVTPAGDRSLINEDIVDLQKKILNDQQLEEFKKTKEFNLGLTFENLGRFRINLFKQRGTDGIVIRRIKTEIPSFSDLHLPDIFKEISLFKRGLILIVGATGSGKSTTLAAMMDYRNQNEFGHIITVEDPIEYVHEHKKSIITQREIGLDTEDYKSALKNALRQAPDVILIGEIRDSETMEAAITFAETGHLCLATLHSNNANQTMERVMNFFPPERHKQIYMQLSLNLQSIISQRLIITNDKNRVPAVEILLGSPRIKDLILKGEVSEIKEAMEKGSSVGMQTFDMALFDLYKSDMISEEEALRNADSVNNLRLKIKLDGDSFKSTSNIALHE